MIRSLQRAMLEKLTTDHNKPNKLKFNNANLKNFQMESFIDSKSKANTSGCTNKRMKTHRAKSLIIARPNKSKIEANDDSSSSCSRSSCYYSDSEPNNFNYNNNINDEDDDDVNYKVSILFLISDDKKTKKIVNNVKNAHIAQLSSIKSNKVSRNKPTSKLQKNFNCEAETVKNILQNQKQKQVASISTKKSSKNNRHKSLNPPSTKSNTNKENINFTFDLTPKHISKIDDINYDSNNCNNKNTISNINDDDSLLKKKSKKYSKRKKSSIQNNSFLPLNEPYLDAEIEKMLNPVRLISDVPNDISFLLTNLDEDNRVVKLKKKYSNVQVYNMYGLIKSVPSSYQRPPLPPTFNSKFWIKTPPLYHYVSDSDIHEQFCNSDDFAQNKIVNNYLYCDNLNKTASEKNDTLPRLSQSLSSFSTSEIFNKVVSKMDSSLESLEIMNKNIEKSSSHSSIECPYSTFNLVKNERKKNTTYDSSEFDNCIIPTVPINHDYFSKTTEDYEECDKDYVDFDNFYMHLHDNDDSDDSLNRDEYERSLNDYYYNHDENRLGTFEMNEIEFDYETRLLELEREQREHRLQIEQKIQLEKHFQRLTKENRVIFYEPNTNSDEELVKYEANLPCLPDAELSFSKVSEFSNMKPNKNTFNGKKGISSVLKNLKQNSHINLSVIAEESTNTDISSNSSVSIAQISKSIEQTTKMLLKEQAERSFKETNLKTRNSTLANKSNSSYSFSSTFTSSSSSENIDRSQYKNIQQLTTPIKNTESFGSKSLNLKLAPLCQIDELDVVYI